MARDETIFALASGAGRAAVAILRLSGPRSSEALRGLAGSLPRPRVAALRVLRHPATGAELDRAIVLWFPAPHSFTGEDCAELQVHGGRAVVVATIEALGAFSGCRLAEPGEFTRRAFLNGKLDLAAVEGLADLIDAETEAQRRQALRQLDGVLGRWAGGLRERLLEARASAEAAIDFADEGDIGARTLEEAVAQAAAIAAELRRELARPPSGERIRQGFVVTLAGPPNAGKSTLLNALARRDVAIVSPHPGTTRDLISVDLDLDGYAVILIDTAGIRETTDPVEQEGVARARARAAASDLVLWLQDVREAPTPPQNLNSVWTIGTKADLASDRTTEVGGYDVIVSAQTGQGLSLLTARINACVTESATDDAALITQQRHRTALAEAEASLSRVERVALDPVLVAEELRMASRAMGRITGAIDVEEVLGAIFARFCIGK